MTARRAVIDRPTPSYFTSDKPLDFVSSGCATLDCVLGGGYVLGRMVNIVGDKSTGKTLLAIEAAANFARIHPNGSIHYAEAEAAFDPGYAGALGMPLDRVLFPDNIFTVEDVFEHITKILEKNGKKPCLYVIDTLDALSTREELDRDIDKGSYNTAKAKLMGELFRRLAQKMEDSRILLMIISQIRDRIGVSFGETKMRTGGRSMDFYASQILWLAELVKIKKEIDHIERVIGVQIIANCKKNKVGLPFRKCEFPILFGYGVDDLTAAAEWLKEIGKLEEAGLSERNFRHQLTSLRNTGGTELVAARELLSKKVKEHWARIETEFLPKRRKYNDQTA